MIQLLIEKLHADLFQGRAGGQELCDDVRTLALFFDHSLQAAHLSFDPLQPVYKFFL